MKKILIILLVLCLLLGGGVGMLFEKSSKANQDCRIKIEQGSNAVAITETLVEAGAFDSQKGLLLRLMTSPYRGQLKYGEYEIKKDMKAQEVFAMIASGKSLDITIDITIPEGYSVEQIGALCEKKKLFSKEAFLEAASTKEGYGFDWLDQIKESKDKKYILQGYLYPDTYNVYKEAKPADVIKLMLAGFDAHMEEVGFEDSEKSMDDIVNEAAIIEKETAVASERATVAGVIENRMKKGMRLEVCPSALYPITDGMYDKTEVTYKDTKVDSPYNTYRNKGLPAGPICNPSVDSMKAAVKPESHGYYFYHTKAKESKEHVFTKTYEEHVKSQ